MGIKKELLCLEESLLKNHPFTGRSSVCQHLFQVIEQKMKLLISEKEEAELKSAEYKQYLIENQNLQSERMTAEQIQLSMLEKRYPAFPEFTGIDLFAEMDAAKEVGGDFYDYFKLDDNRICFSIADVEGKGIPAALYMAVVKTMIRIRLENGESLSAVLTSVNEQLCTSSMQKRFITIWIGILEISTGKLTYVNAGHNFPVLKQQTAPARLLRNRSGLPLASYFSKKKKIFPYTEFTCILEEGDILLLYTDGITEAMNPSAEQYGENRLLQSMDLYTGSTDTMQKFSAWIKRRIISFSDSTEQSDDITLLCLKYH